MNSVLRRLLPITKNRLYLFKQKFQVDLSLISRRYQPDEFFTVEEERELTNPEYYEISNEFIGVLAKGHRAFVIQPYIKFGKQKKTNTNPELQLSEAVALVETLPYWFVVDKMCVPLYNFASPKLFGKGKMNEIIMRIRNGNNITAVFISNNTLKHAQILELQKIFGIPVYDRYSLVIHIFRCHAKSPEAKLQVAIAELPYIYQKMSELGDRINLLEKRKLYLQARESRLRFSLEKLKHQRILVRNRRKDYGLPCVAIVGYTNAGKTSLIKGKRR